MEPVQQHVIRVLAEVGGATLYVRQKCSTIRPDLTPPAVRISISIFQIRGSFNSSEPIYLYEAMSKTITLADELHKRLSEFGNRDESYNTIIARILEHTDEEGAQNDRMNRITTYERIDGDEDSLSGNPAVEALKDGTEVRWTIDSGDYDDVRIGEVDGGRIRFQGTTWRPSGFAREADQDIRGNDARNSKSYAGPREVEYRNEDGEWVPIQSVLEEE